MAKQTRSPQRRSKKGKNVFVTKSGHAIKINQSLGARIRAKKDEKSRRKAEYLSTLPINKFKRLLYRLHPRRLAKYWFSRDGAIMLLKLTGIGIVFCFILLIGLFAYFRKDLPNINDVSQSNLGGSINYYDRTGTVLLFQDYGAVKRVVVPGTQISPYMKEATVAIEDKNFYHEGAFSFSGIVRAGLHDVFGGSNSGLQGASTITEQLVKLNENYTGSRTIATKIKEVILAVELERQYTKDEVLTGYLNIAPYGGVDYGVQAAAQDYFHENANQLTLAQSAMLAAIPQSPSYFSPFSSPQFNSAASVNDFGEQALIDRQQYILDQMVKQGYITKSQASAAKQVNVLAQVQPLENKYSGIVDPYFVLAAKQQLENQYGAATVNRGGWKVITTLNVPLQNIANYLVQKNLPNVESAHGDQEAMVAESTQTGQVDALVGGVDFNNPDYGQINYAESPIPPGSSFKPYDYSTLINDTNNVGAGSLLYDVKQPLPGYPCTTGSLQPLQGGNCLEDYDFKFPGPEELRYALAGSRNVPAAKAMLSVIPNSQCIAGNLAGCVPSINKVISTADAMMDVPNAYQCYSDVELTDPTQCYTSSAFGDGAYLTLAEHVNGLATLARMGVAIPQTLILKITDSNNKVIYNWTQPKGTQVIQPDTAYILNNILSDPDASYLPASQKFQSYDGWNIAVKTGTTNNEYDALMTAWTTQYAVVSWAGYHTRNVALTAGLSETVTEPMTRDFIQDALSMLNEKPVNWVQPADIKVLPSYVQTAHIDYGDVEPGPSTDLYPSWYVAPNKGGSTVSETIDKVSGGVATSCTPPLAKQTTSVSNENAFSIDLFYPPNQSANSSAAAATTNDTAHSCNDPPVPTPIVTISTGGSNSNNTDQAGDYVCNGACTFTVTTDFSSLPIQTQGSTPVNRYPVNINVLENGTPISVPQTVTSPGLSTLTFSYTPQSTTTPVQITSQAVDAALYSSSSATQTIVETPGPG